MLRMKKVHKRLISILALMTYLYCLHIYTLGPDFVEIRFLDYNWKELSEEVFVLSAYFDDRLPTPVVRVISIAKYKKEFLVKKHVRDTQPKQYAPGAFQLACEAEYPGEEREAMDYEAKVFEEGGEKYAATFFLCYPKQSRAPSHVIISAFNTSSRLVVQKVEAVDSRAGSSAVCVRPLFGPYDKLGQVAQFMAFYSQVLGVNTFSFPLMDVSDRIKLFLAQAQTSETVLELTDWNLPLALEDWTVLWDYGALAALTDCVYRHMADHQFVFIVDLDEFIVPQKKMKKHTTSHLVKMIEESKSPPVNKTSDAFLFRNTFFCSEFNPDIDFDEDFSIFSAGTREDFLWSFQLRSKMLVRPERVVSVGHHRVHDWLHPDTSFNTPVPHQVALLYHYRHCHTIREGLQGQGNTILSHSQFNDDQASKFENIVKKSQLLNLAKNMRPIT